MSTECDYCRANTPIYGDSFHIKDFQDDEKLLGTPGNFCGAFYHVCHGGKPWLCLDRGSCTVFKEPKTAVALVRYENEHGDPLFVKRYTNCPDRRSKKHAEEFVSRNINPSISNHKELIDSTDGETVKKITMYITMQPCHLSTIGTEGTHNDQSFCKIIAKALVVLPDHVKIFIRPTHLLRVGYKKKINAITRKGREQNLCIDNAEKGIKALMRIGERIEVSAMKRNDWFFLLGFVNL